MGESVSREARLALARVLTALGRLAEAQDLVVGVIDHDDTDPDAVGLLAKIKHLRGELSQAIALWAALQVRTPRVGTALVQLAALRRLAESPERSAGEFVALGDGQMVKKHLAQIELERAFGLLSQGKVDDAVAVCEVVAERHKLGRGEVYKLATLARAWIRELTGNLQGARVALEGLGTERGFETDTDRLLLLARIYERLGRPGDVAAAIKVHLHLEGATQRLSTHAHLAHLYRLAGDDRLAEESARRYLLGFRRRMHKPTREDVVRAAAQRYLPLFSLAALSTVDLGPEELSRGPLHDGLRAALLGETEVAERCLSDAGPLGRAYLGDLHFARGEEELAARDWAQALESLPNAAGVVARLTEHAVGRPALARLASDPDRLAAALDGLLEFARNAPDDPAAWRRLAVLESIAGRGEAAERHATKASALEEAGMRREYPGRVLSAAVYRFVGKSKGLIHELWAERHPVEPGRGGGLDPSALHGNLAPELVEGTRNAFVAIRQYTRTKFPHLTRDIDAYRYSFKVTKEDEPSGGLSAGLPTALAFFSVFTGRPVPSDVALTGAVVADAHDVLAVRNVGDIEPKIKGAYNRDLRLLVVPSESRQEVVRSLMVPAEVSSEVVRYASSFDEAIELVYGNGVWEW